MESPSVTPKLDVVAIFKTSLADAFPLMRSRAQLWLVFAIVLAAAALALSFVPAATPADLLLIHEPYHTWRHRAGLTNHVRRLVELLAWLYVVGSVLRTARPAWHWTAARFFGYLLLTLIVWAPTLAGNALLPSNTAPAVAIALGICAAFYTVRFWWAPWCYLLSDGANELSESWKLTGGAFWPSLLLLMVRFALIWLAAMLGFELRALSVAWPPSGLVLLPLSFFCDVWVLHVAFLADVRWLSAMRARGAPAAPLGASAA